MQDRNFIGNDFISIRRLKLVFEVYRLVIKLDLTKG